jgi:DNA-binding transcriptional MocR family regulator
VPVAPWQRQRLNGAERNAIMTAARRLERQTRRRGSGQHGGDLKQSSLQVLWHLLFHGWGKAGACDPSLQQVAEGAGLARSTVQVALERLEAFGILARIRRGLVVGRRWAQVTNSYLFRAPPRWLWPSDTDYRPALDSESEKEAQEVEWLGADTALTAAALAALASKWGLLSAETPTRGVGEGLG